MLTLYVCILVCYTRCQPNEVYGFYNTRRKLYPILVFFFIPFVTLALLWRSLPVVTQMRVTLRGPSSPLPTIVRAIISSIATFYSIVGSGRIVRTPTLLGALST